jgi:hypothetical protein|tara:strand:- start:1086 stop:1199 length:114 start_codon:yes stop_codon:yes gene_type:complete
MSDKPKVVTSNDTGNPWHGEKPDTRRKMNTDKKKSKK